MYPKEAREDNKEESRNYIRPRACQETLQVGKARQAEDRWVGLSPAFTAMMKGDMTLFTSLVTLMLTDTEHSRPGISH